MKTLFERFITVVLIQLVLLFSIQHYFSDPIKVVSKSLTICKSADLPNDFNEIPELDELVLDEDKGDERSHPFSRFLVDQPSYYSTRHEFFENSYGVHLEPYLRSKLPTYLLKRVLLI